MNANFNVNKRKKELIRENIDVVPIAKRGRRLAGVSLSVIAGLRIFLLIFELIYSAAVSYSGSVIPHVLILPYLLILYMVYDGNKSLVYIGMISAPVRLVYHFSTVLPMLPGDNITALTVVSLIVLFAQFILSVFMAFSTRCDVYFSGMQKVNLKLRSEMIK